MDMNMLAMANNLEQGLEKENSLAVAREQNRFLETAIGAAVNKGIDMGIRAIFPNFLEDAVISLKDSLFQDGLTSMVRSAIDRTLEFGRRAMRFFQRAIWEFGRGKRCVREW